MSTRTISRLRERMIEDMEARRLSPATQRFHINSCKRFAKFLGRSPETATPEDVRRFQHHLTDNGISIMTRNRVMTGVKFLLRVTMRRADLAGDIYHLREPKKVPQVLSQEEVNRLLKMAPNLKAHVLLALAYGCGLRVSEVVKLKAGDIDSVQGVIRIVQAPSRRCKATPAGKEGPQRPARHVAGRSPGLAARMVAASAHTP